MPVHMTNFPTQPMRVLLVEDDPIILEFTLITLQQAGFAVETANNGKGALQSIKSSLPQLVVTDIVMPDMDGLELIRTIRKLNMDVPILAISGKGPEAGDLYLKEAKIFGANAGLLKPFSQNDFLGEIRRLLGMTD